MVHVPVEQVFDTGRIHASTHLRDGTVHHTLPGVDIAIIGRPSGKLARHLLASLTADLYQKFMPVVFEDLRQGKIIAGPGHRASVH
jgi:hypothetical protein